MKVFYCTSFTGQYPVGASAVIVAKSRKSAAHLLEEALAERGLRQKIDPKDLTQINTKLPEAIILQDGDY